MGRAKHDSVKIALVVLVLIIANLSVWASYEGIFSVTPVGETAFTSINGETITLYGKGLYHKDSISAAAQGIAQDWFTIVVAVPLLLLALFGFLKGSLRGHIALTGLLGYFLYTYLSYAMLWQYNKFFLVYVILFSASLYGFILTALRLNRTMLQNAYSQKLPVRWIGGFQIFIGFMISLLWLGRIASGMGGKAPVGLEHYTTLVIQAMDLGLVVPAAVLSGVLLIKRSSWGYWLSSIVIFKGSAMLLAIMGMILNQYLNGVAISAVEVGLFSVFTLMCLSCLAFLMFMLDEPRKI